MSVNAGARAAAPLLYARRCQSAQRGFPQFLFLFVGALRAREGIEADTERGRQVNAMEIGASLREETRNNIDGSLVQAPKSLSFDFRGDVFADKFHERRAGLRIANVDHRRAAEQPRQNIAAAEIAEGAVLHGFAKLCDIAQVAGIHIEDEKIAVVKGRDLAGAQKPRAGVIACAPISAGIRTPKFLAAVAQCNVVSAFRQSGGRRCSSRSGIDDMEMKNRIDSSVIASLDE
jgi:hypothetical protein